MTDLSRLIDNLCAGLEGPVSFPLSGCPETLSGVENQQASDAKENFRSFHSFRLEIEATGKTASETSEIASSQAGGSRVASSYVGEPERPETPEREAKTLAGSTVPFFPVEDREPERPETESATSKPPVLDLNRAGPQRSDWWTGDLMAEVDRAAPPPGDPLPISPSDVRAGVARELRALAEDGREGPGALRDAIEITRAKIRNSEALADRQAHGGRCHVCDGPLDDSAPVVAVMTGKRGSHLHLHAGCCGAHSARMAALVDRIMTAAGYGEILTNGEEAA